MKKMTSDKRVFVNKEAVASTRIEILFKPKLGHMPLLQNLNLTQPQPHHRDRVLRKRFLNKVSDSIDIRISKLANLDKISC